MNLRCKFSHGQAGAVDGDARPQFHICQDFGGFDRQSVRTDEADFAHFFNNAGEQLSSPDIAGNHHVAFGTPGFNPLQFN